MIDLSRLPLPNAIETLDPEALITAFMERFVAVWAQARLIDPSLPQYNVERHELDPVVFMAEVWANLRLLDRQRVNDAVKALLAPFSSGADLDNVVARQGLDRLVVVPATMNAPAILESDVALLQRYLLSFERASAGSAARYIFEARTAWPQSADRQLGLWDARVNGHAVHGRRGDTDIVIIGPFGRDASAEEAQLVRAAVTAPHVQPEAVAVTVVKATRHEYVTNLVIEVPAGPDPQLVQAEAMARVSRAALARTMINGEIPSGYLAGAAYGDSIIRVQDLAPIIIERDPYTIPIQSGLTITVEVRS